MMMFCFFWGLAWLNCNCMTYTGDLNGRVISAYAQSNASAASNNNRAMTWGYTAHHK